MIVCSKGHENEDGTDRCEVCGTFLPGTKLGTPFQPGESGGGEYALNAKARRWVEDAGLEWDDLPQAEKDIIKKANKANAPVGIIERALMIIGQYQAKPKASDSQQAEVVEVLLTADSVANLKKSLKVLKELAGA